MKNKALALRALAKDCELRGVYINRAGETCAIGCLALLAGVPEKHLVQNNWEPVQDLPRIQIAIHKKFGLKPEHLITIQVLNDGSRILENRRKKVIRFIRRFK